MHKSHLKPPQPPWHSCLAALTLPFSFLQIRPLPSPPPPRLASPLASGLETLGLVARGVVGGGGGEMEAALEAARAKDTKERLAGVERLHEALDAAARQRGLTAGEVTALVDTCMDLIRDANFRVAQGGLQALSAAAVVAGDHFKIHLNALVPAAVERLGDGKQPVREAARQLLITLMEVRSCCLQSHWLFFFRSVWELDGAANTS